MDRITDAHDEPNAMVNAGGDTFYPDSMGDALLFFREHDALPVDVWAWLDFLTGQ